MHRYLAAALLLSLSTVGQAATVLMDGRLVMVDETLADPTELWVRVDDLTRVNGFELKPEGACLDAICVPVRQDEDSEIFVSRAGYRWFNVTELAERIQQPWVANYEHDVWSLGAIPAQRASFLHKGIAPDFTLSDWRGETHSLSDFKGKKIMLLSWASW